MSDIIMGVKLVKGELLQVTLLEGNSLDIALKDKAC